MIRLVDRWLFRPKALRMIKEPVREKKIWKVLVLAESTVLPVNFL